MYKDIYEMILECEAQRKDNEKIVYAIGAGRLFPKVGFIKNQKKAFKEISNRKGFIGVHPIDLWHTLLLFDTLNHAKSAKNYLSEKGIQLGEIAPVLVPEGGDADV